MTQTIELQQKLERAEKQQAELLESMNAVDRELAGLQPADPRRVELKAKKAEMLPRYRGAKQNAKDLRRLINSMPVPKPQPDAEEVLDEDEDARFGELYKTLTNVLDQHKTKNGIVRLDALDVQRIEDFIEWNRVWEIGAIQAALSITLETAR